MGRAPVELSAASHFVDLRCSIEFPWVRRLPMFAYLFCMTATVIESPALVQYRALQIKTYIMAPPGQVRLA